MGGRHIGYLAESEGKESGLVWMDFLVAKPFIEAPTYVDMDPDSWTVRRGAQTIVEKLQ